MQNHQASVRLFFGVFVLGACFSLILAVLATWSNLEAAFYGFERRASTPLPGLHCPILLNRTETGIVSIKVSNTTTQKLSASVRAEFSSPLTPMSSLSFADLKPGESKTLQWTIGPENIDLGYFIFSQVLVYSTYPLPDRESSCGTFIVDTSIPGTVLTGSLLLLGLAGIVVGLGWLWRIQAQSVDTLRALRPCTFLGIMIVVTLSFSLFGLWLQALVCLAVVLTMLLVTLNFLVFK